MITFRAQYIQPITIQKREPHSNSYKDYNVAVVELSPESKNDYISINRLNSLWGNKKTLVDDTATVFNDIHRELTEQDGNRFFAATLQKDSFEKLREEDILGVIHTQNIGETLDIENFQIDPDTNYDSIVRNYKHIGESLIKAIINLFPEKEVFLEAKSSAKPFYEKLGFKLLSSTNEMLFRK